MKEQNYLDHLVGVLGQPVAENPGVVIQDAAFRALGLERWRYLTLDVDKDKLGDAIRGLKALKMRGVNCTIPHKIAVMEYLDEISESARLIGAVNTIVNDNGRLYGDNTDGKGFMMSLQSNGVDVRKENTSRSLARAARHAPSAWKWRWRARRTSPLSAARRGAPLVRRLWRSYRKTPGRRCAARTGSASTASLPAPTLL